MSVFRLTKEPDQDGNQQSCRNAQEIGIQVGRVGNPPDGEDALQAFEAEGGHIAQQRSDAEGPPPGAEVERQREEDREWQEHGEVDAFVKGKAQDAFRQFHLRLAAAETQVRHDGDVRGEKDEHACPV